MSVPASARRTGRVKFFNSQKGFGFIIPSESSETNPVDETCLPAAENRHDINAHHHHHTFN
ncbi:hypothetical protein BGX20_008270 [Mortierella sp. AD010]|nr:hypothetical protein BGX20_008270 [Mortierella sp. AD010]